MTIWQRAVLIENSAQLKIFGEPITYIPNAGVGDPIVTICLLGKPLIDQSASPGYFADIEVDPAAITNPQRKDMVIWADGTAYLVSKVVNLPYGLTALALHRKLDPL